MLTSRMTSVAFIMSREAARLSALFLVELATGCVCWQCSKTDGTCAARAAPTLAPTTVAPVAFTTAADAYGKYVDFASTSWAEPGWFAKVSGAERHQVRAVPKFYLFWLFEYPV